MCGNEKPTNGPLLHNVLAEASWGLDRCGVDSWAFAWKWSMQHSSVYDALDVRQTGQVKRRGSSRF